MTEATSFSTSHAAARLDLGTTPSVSSSSVLKTALIAPTAFSGIASVPPAIKFIPYGLRANALTGALKISRISEERDLKTFVERMNKAFTENPKSVVFQLSVKNMQPLQILPGLRSVLEKQFDFTFCNTDTDMGKEIAFRLSPKIKATEDLGEGSFKVTYQNGVVEERWLRIFADGIHEWGRTVDGTHTKSHQLQDGQYTFFDPEIFPYAASIGFVAFTAKGDKPEWTMVERVDGSKDTYVPCTKFSYEEMALHIVLKEKSASLNDMLALQNCPIDIDKLLHLVLQSPSHLFLFNYNDLLLILQLACRQKVVIDCSKILSSTGDNLFLFWLRKSSDTIPNIHSPLICQMLAMQPELALSRGADGVCAFDIASRTDQGIVLDVIARILAQSKVDLSIPMQWMIKAIINDTAFEIKEFCALQETLQFEIYRLANRFGKKEFVKKLSPALKLPKDNLEPQTYNILSESMDADTAHLTVEGFVKTLRKSKRLLNDQEFAQLKQAQGKFLVKGTLQRILGADYIQKIISQLGLKHIKVPLKVAVLSNAQQFTIHLRRTLPQLEIDSYDVQVHAQVIPEVARKISREEMLELVALIEAAGFGDVHDHNFIVAKDGIYLIDTEYKSLLNDLDWDNMPRLTNMLNPSDRDWYKNLIQEKAKQADELSASKKEALGKMETLRDKCNGYFALRERYTPFIFETADILGVKHSEAESKASAEVVA